MRSTSCAATLNERLEPLPGDDLVPDAVLCATHAICIEAPAERVWPWLAQMGAGRGGWYSHDWVDGRRASSADRLIPGVRDPTVGDVIPGTPDGTPGFVVSHVRAPHELVLLWPSRDIETASASWAFVLRGSPRGDRTRLLVRARLSHAALHPTPPEGAARTLAERIFRVVPYVPGPVLRAMASLGHDFMQRGQLRGLKRRAEAPAGG
jgi:hypothetical protein